MKTKLVLLITAILISSSLFTACNQQELSEDTKNKSDKNESLLVGQAKQDNATTSDDVEKNM